MEQVFRYIDRMFDRFIEELSSLCACRSVAGDCEGLAQACSLISGKLSSLGFDPHHFGTSQEATLIYGQSKAFKSKPSILFYNHYDVVPEGAREAWETPPFQLTRKGGRLHARGVSDNKGALMARLQAVEAILAVKGALPIRLAFLLDGDEETGSAALSRLAYEDAPLLRKLTDADLCIWENGRTLPDGSPEAAFGVRSTLVVRMEARSSNGDEHGRMGAELPNAAWRLVWALASLKSMDEHIRIDGFYDDVLPPTKADLDVVSAYPYDEEGMLARKEIPQFLLGLRGQALKQKIFLEPSLNINGLEAGEPWKGFRHIVPHAACAQFSVILVPNQRADDILEKIRKHLDASGFEDIAIRADAAGFPVRTPVDTPWRHVLARAAAQVYPQPLTPSITQLGSGPAYLLRTVRPELPILCACGVAALDGGHHSVKENITLENYKNGIKFAAATILEAEKGVAAHRTLT